MLMQDGTSRGNEPTVKVLEVAQHEDRKPDDLLPYVANFAKFFRKLPNNPQDLILKTAFVPLNDIECFTKTTIDVPESVQNLNRKKGKWQPLRYGSRPALTTMSDTLKLAQDQFLPLCGSWDYEDWDEYDYSRITSLKFRELEDARKKEGQNAVSKECLMCPNFLKHVSGCDRATVRSYADDYHSLPWSMINGSSRRTFLPSDSLCQTRTSSFCLTTNSVSTSFRISASLTKVLA